MVGVTAVVVAGAAVIGTLVHDSASASTVREPPSASAVHDSPSPAAVHDSASASSTPTGEAAALPDVTQADGLLPAGATPSDTRYPGIANLRPDLLAALRRAATDAAAAGVRLDVTSGWRSAAYQSRLPSQAVATYGSPAEAARWVAGPTTSSHVSGSAVDVGPSAAASWLARHGAAYGLCQTYRNEPWHDELRPVAVRTGCPAMYADPTQDPRLQR